MHPWFIKHIDKRIKESTGVEIIIEQGQTFTFNITRLKQEEDSLTIQEKTTFSDSNKIKTFLNSKVETILSIDGKGVLHKDVSALIKKDEIHLEELAHEVFPGINVQDFHIQLFQTNENGSYLSLIRVELFNTILKHFTDNDLYPISIVLGPFSISLLRKITEINTFDTNLYAIQFSDSSIKLNTIPEHKNNNDIGGDSIEPSFVIAYSNALLKYNTQKLFLNSFDNIIEENKQEFFYKYISKTLFISIISVLLVLLVLNLLFQANYRGRNKELSFQYKKNEKRINEIRILEGNIKQKELFITQNNLSKTTKLTHYVERIAKLRPDGVFLQELFVSPLYNKLGNIDLEEFDNNTILLSGEGASSKVNQFLIKLRNEDWIIDVDMEHFENKNNSSKGSFKVRLTIAQ